MDTDSGITRKLPPMPDKNQKTEQTKINERNLLIVLINKSDRLLVNNQEMRVEDVRQHAIEFITNPANKPDLPEKKYKVIMVKNPDYYEGSSLPKKIKHLVFFKLFPNGYPVSKGVVTLQNDRGTSYKQYMAVQNELVAAYNVVRDNLSMQVFGKKFADLDNDSDINAIRAAIPINISEAEPKNIGG